MAYIGKEPIVGNFQKCDAITVVNGQAAYTLQVSSTNVIPESANHMLVSLNGILQAPVTSFTVSGSTLTFASNLATGDVIDFVILLGNVLDLGTVSDSTISTAKIVDGAVTSAKLSAGKILQIVQASHTSVTSITSTTYADVGLTASITPISTSNKVLALVYCSVGVAPSGSAGDDAFLSLVRVSTAIGGGNTVDSDAFFHVSNTGGDYEPRMCTFTYLDSPSSTSSTAYKVQMKNRNSSKQSYFNRRGGDTMGLISYITLMEVAG